MGCKVPSGVRGFLAAYLPTWVALRSRLPHGTGGKHGRRRGFVGRAQVTGPGRGGDEVIAAAIV